MAEVESRIRTKREEKRVREVKNGLASQEAGEPHTSGFMAKRLQEWKCEGLFHVRNHSY
jgi:predicted transcriptional regulator